MGASMGNAALLQEKDEPYKSSLFRPNYVHHWHACIVEMDSGQAPLAVVTQTLVELAAMVILVRLVPRLAPLPPSVSAAPDPRLSRHTRNGDRSTTQFRTDTVSGGRNRPTPRPPPETIDLSSLSRFDSRHKAEPGCVADRHVRSRHLRVACRLGSRS